MISQAQSIGLLFLESDNFYRMVYMYSSQQGHSKKYSDGTFELMK